MRTTQEIYDTPNGKVRITSSDRSIIKERQYQSGKSNKMVSNTKEK